MMLEIWFCVAFQYALNVMFKLLHIDIEDFQSLRIHIVNQIRGDETC